MRQPFSRPRLMKEGRDAIIAERLGGGPPAKCPYRPQSQSRSYWQRAPAAPRTQSTV